MKYSPILIVHICGGVIGVLSGSMALIARKGFRLHRRAGDVFVISMLVMGASGAYAAFTKSQMVNVIAGLFTFYLVGTAWMTVMRREKETGRIEIGLLLLGLAVGTMSLMIGWDATNGTRVLKADESAVAFMVFGSVAMVSATGDVRMLIRGGVSGAQRLARHLWRMCVALMIAAGSFFLGMSGDPVLRRTGLRATLFPAEIRKTHLPEVPVLIIVILTIYWVCRVLFAKAYKSKVSEGKRRERMVRTEAGAEG
jgi:uncharacterized membrane protein